MKNLSILGSTGSIGTNALEVVRRFPETFNVAALCAKTSVDALAAQIVEFEPELAAVFDADGAARLKARLPAGCATEIVYGPSGYRQTAECPVADTVVTAMVGAAGLEPTIAAINTGKTICLANKETLVMAGEVVMALAREKGVVILPIDSEHSAIFQCLEGNRREDLDRILLTASGGPFRTRPQEAFGEITLEDALNHPNWSMGPKITIDSATLMNKGLEVIEASHLFNVSLEQIEVVVHPQSIIHSMVAYRDGSVIAQLGVPDMKGAIAYALSYPERLALGQPAPDFAGIGRFDFEKPDLDRFPCLALAFTAARQGGTLPAVLNAANETAVAAFLEKRINFTDIPVIIEKTMRRHAVVDTPGLEDIMDADRWARKTAADSI
ncbi:MAG: 1-deoxy-D-xylulose-5-phosphate reductoisomerase [Desulfobacterales bacterium]|nr:1-deoxy-D-xylulose-5-phosphate reductoisomerase [Desulfobacterales bacterium]